MLCLMIQYFDLAKYYYIDHDFDFDLASYNLGQKGYREREEDAEITERGKLHSSANTGHSRWGARILYRDSRGQLSSGAIYTANRF